jgi:hypothetical protein
MAKEVVKYNKTHYNHAKNTRLATYPETNSDKYNQHNIQDREMKEIHEDFNQHRSNEL